MCLLAPWLTQLDKLGRPCFGKDGIRLLLLINTKYPDPFTYVPCKRAVFPHQNNEHAMYRKPYWNGRLFLAGSETANAFPGYMEGAVRSAEWVYQALSKSPAL